MLRFALEPRSVAVIGASDNPHKVGGWPLLYLRRYGYRGAIYPVNPARASVQGLRAFARVEDLPEAPELAIVAVAGEEAVRAVEACAAKGVRVVLVMASGFGETGPEGLRVQHSLVETARRAGMRLIGPNCQGLANFANGVVANFSTIFHETEARDGPVAIVSQSGANSQAIYTLVRERGLGVRHVHATGNEADVTVSDLAAAVVADPGVRLLLLYLEAIKDPPGLAAAAQAARERDLPIVALKAGRTARGQKAASSHTGALASEDRVVDAFFERHAIWRAEDPHELVSAAALYLSGRRPRGRRLVFISNSGASCVMAADYAERAGLALAEVSEQAKQKMRQVLPPFAGLDNPIDVTGALLGNPKLFSAVLPAVGEDARSDLLVVALPVAGTGYDVPGLAEDLRQFCERYDHAARLRKRVPELREAQIALPQGGGRFLDEAQSLAALARAGLPVVEHRLCRNAAEAAAAARLLGPEIVMKACSPDLPHKSDHGLVCLSVAEPETEFHRQADVARTLGARFEGVIVARKAAKGRELALGARVDPQFGPVVLVGDGGVYLEALKDYRLLVPPFDEEEVADKLRELRIAPLLGAWRGEPARDVQAFAGMARRLGEAITAWGGAVAAVDVNPVMVFETGRGALAVDALIERAV